MKQQNVQLNELEAEMGAGILAGDEPATATEEMDEDTREKVLKLMESVDVTDSQSIIHFGSSAQAEMGKISQTMMGGVKNKDSGEAGSLLNNMMVNIRKLDTSTVRNGKKPGFFSRLLGAVEPIARFVQQYESVESQVQVVERELETHILKLSRDVEMLDKLYNSTLEFYRELEYYIVAGDMKLAKLDSEDIPAAQTAADKSGDLLEAQQLRDLKAARDDLERKVHDLKLTRQTVMQFLPTMRITQENDKALINKMNSSLVNTLNLWRVQMAQSIALTNAKNSADFQKDVSDMNNQLLEANAKNLQESNAAIRNEMERGVFDIDSIERSNQTLIDVIQESIDIAEEGRQKRAEAEERLLQCEQSLKQSLRGEAVSAG